MEYHDGQALRHVGDLPAMGAYRYGEMTAIVLQENDEHQSFAALDERASRVASALTDRGVEPGDRVALYLPNTLQFPESLFGAVRTGAVPVPLNLRMDVETLSYVLEDADVDHLVTSALLAGGMETERASIAAPAEVCESAGVTYRYVPSGEGEGVVDYDTALAEADPEFDRPERAFDDVAIQTYTSGTTGRPKGVLLSHENVLSALAAMTRSGSPDPDSTVLMVLPLFHIPTFVALLGTHLYRGGRTILQAIPDPEGMLDAIETYEVNELPAVPALHTMMYRAYREDPDAHDVSSLDVLGSAAAPLPEDTKRNLTRDFGVVMSEGWGMTETTSVATARPATVYKDAGCVGQPVKDVDLRLVDPETREPVVPADELDPWTGPPKLEFDDEEAVTGEIAVRGPQVFEGYHGLPEKNQAVFDEEGWFYTEDIARVDDDGHLWMVDRADDMIIAGGENIYPAEVEDALYEHPDVAEAAVVAAPHEVKGEAPVAFVVAEAGTTLDETELRRFALERVASYAHPRRVFLVDELPRSATQKVQRYKLETEVEDRLGGPLEPSEKL